MFPELFNAIIIDPDHHTLVIPPYRAEPAQQLCADLRYAVSGRHEQLSIAGSLLTALIDYQLRSPEMLPPDLRIWMDGLGLSPRLVSIPAGYAPYRLAVAQMMRECPEWESLLNPSTVNAMLLLALIGCSVDHNGRIPSGSFDPGERFAAWQDLRTRLRSPYCARGLLEFVVGDGLSKSQVKTFQRHALTVPSFEDLLEALNLIVDSPRAARLLSHSPCWTRRSLQVLKSPWAADANGRLLERIEAGAIDLGAWMDVMRHYHRFGLAAGQRSVVRGAYRMADFLAMAARLAAPDPRLCGVQVRPPLPPAKGMRPLTTADAIASEAQAMGHCLFNRFATAILPRGWMAAYAIDLPERATLLLKSDPNSPGLWAIVDLRGPDNAPVSAELAEFVQEWLAESRQPPVLTPVRIPPQY